jgi:hypothetical protein
MKVCDKRKSHISSKLHIIYIDSNNGWYPVTENFTPFHYTSPNYTSLHLSTFADTALRLIQTSPSYTSLWLYPIQISYRSISPHITKLHLTWLHFIAPLDYFRHTSVDYVQVAAHPAHSQHTPYARNYTKQPLCRASWRWASNARNM